MVSKTQTHRVGRNSSSIAGAICDFRQSRLRRSSKLSLSYTESNEQLVSSIKKMMKMNDRYLISEIQSSPTWPGLTHFRFDLGQLTLFVPAGSLCPTRPAGRYFSSVCMVRSPKHLSLVSRDEPYRPHPRGKALVCEHVVQQTGVPIKQIRKNQWHIRVYRPTGHELASVKM